MAEAFLALVSIFWVQLSMHVLHYGLRWSKYITRFGCATVLWIPVMLGVFIEYTSFMVCIEYTDHNSVLPVTRRNFEIVLPFALGPRSGTYSLTARGPLDENQGYPVRCLVRLDLLPQLLLERAAQGRTVCQGSKVKARLQRRRARCSG